MSIRELKIRNNLGCGTLFRYFVILLCIGIMLCVWPGCLVRRNTLISSNMANTYLATEPLLTTDAPFKQTFVAVEARLDSIEFALCFQEELPEAKLQFDLQDANGNIIFGQEIDSTALGNYSFYQVDINKWIRKGEEYTFSVSVPEELNAMLQGVYAEALEPCIAGNTRLAVGEVLIDGYAVTRYGYGFPLNVKNVICIGAFLTSCCILLCGLIKSDRNGEKQDTYLTRLLAKGMHAVGKLWAIVEKYQVLLLLLEMAGILLLVAYICCVRIVDWDEAYSLRMVTKLSFADMLQVTAADIHPPLYYILLRLFSGIFGDSVFALKMLSVLFTVCVMLLGITKIRKYWGFEVAFLFNLVIGLGPQFIAYAVNIRMYSLSFLLVMLCALLAYEIVQGKGKWNWCFFVMVALAGVYTHYFNVFPLALIYGYLLVALFLENRKQCKWFWVSCIATVLGYLPWLGVVFQTFGRAGVREEGVSVEGFDYVDLFQWAFSSNIEFSMYMPLLLFVVCVVIVLVERKKWDRKDILFLVMSGGNLLFTYFGCRLIASVTARFWDNRYVFASLGLFWLSLLIVCSKRGKAVFCSMVIWIGVISASAYVIQMAKEVGADSYVTAAYEVLEPVQDEEIVLYNYDTYDVLYGAHLRKPEFVFIDDVDWEKLNKDYVYMISWGGHWLQPEIEEKYHLRIEKCGTMRLEEGVAGVELYKITFDAG